MTMPKNSYSWHWKKLADLEVVILYRIMALRSEVFVVEQDCVYQDLDGLDEAAYHCFAIDSNDQPVAYSRVLPAGLAYSELAIGRVVTSASVRGSGLGHELLQRTLQHCEHTWGHQAIKLSAQEHLQGYYQRWGFNTISEVYLEDGIPHVAMLRK
ncbi:MAG: GNAT family N-acetyltransferase [Salibacteraceae bacterium]